MSVARIVGGLGRVAIAAGLVLLSFVAYQLWGTGLAEAQAQDELRASFAATIADDGPPAPPTTDRSAPGPPGPGPSTTGPAASTEDPATSTERLATASDAEAVPAPAPAPEGEAVALIRIPAVGVDKAVVSGVTVDALRKGPGHYPSTPLPGQRGNAAIAGHRTTYGAPFGPLDGVADGDEILVTTRQGEFRYVVDRISVVEPSQVEVLDQTEEARLTLTTCHPRYSARQRLVVSAVLAGDPLPAAPAAPTTASPEVAGGDGAATDPPAEQEGDPVDPPPVDAADVDPPPVDEVDEDTVDEPAVPARPEAIDDPSLAGDPSARGPAAAWGGATALVALAGWLLGRRWRRWPAYLLSAPVGVTTLFLCFEQVNRLLPANI